MLRGQRKEYSISLEEEKISEQAHLIWASKEEGTTIAEVKEEGNNEEKKQQAQLPVNIQGSFLCY